MVIVLYSSAKRGTWGVTPQGMWFDLKLQMSLLLYHVTTLVLNSPNTAPDVCQASFYTMVDTQTNNKLQYSSRFCWAQVKSGTGPWAGICQLQEAFVAHRKYNSELIYRGRGMAV